MELRIHWRRVVGRQLRPPDHFDREEPLNLVPGWPVQSFAWAGIFCGWAHPHRKKDPSLLPLPRRPLRLDLRTGFTAQAVAKLLQAGWVKVVNRRCWEIQRAGPLRLPLRLRSGLRQNRAGSTLRKIIHFANDHASGRDDRFLGP